MIGSKEKDFYSRRPIPASSDFDPYSDFEKDIALLREKVSIADVVRRYVKIRRPNKNWMHLVGFCPFHTEKTPSFGVSPMKGIFHCWGCGQGGDIFKFIQKIEGVTFSGAVKILKKMYKIGRVRKFAKIYKKRYFDIIARFNENGEKIEYLEFLEDEISEKVRDVIYAEKEEKYARLHSKSLEEVLNEKEIKPKRQCFHNH